MHYQSTSVGLQAERGVKDRGGKEGDDENGGLIGEHRASEASEITGEQQDRKEEEEEEEEAEKPWETLTGAKAKAKVKLFQERHWVVTEIFYANLAAATERLEATRTQGRG